MAIAFDQEITGTAGTQGNSPLSSPSFTPAAAGEVALVCALDQTQNGTATMTITGTGGSFTNINFDYSGSASTSQAYCLALSGAAQTVTAADSGAYVLLVGILYSGVGSLTTSHVVRTAPGTGTGAITGNSVVVPTGSVLIAICIDTGDNSTIVNANGTLRGGGNGSAFYVTTEFDGTGVAVTPEFTDATNGATDLYIVVQFLLSPPAGSSAPLYYRSKQLIYLEE